MTSTQQAGTVCHDPLADARRRLEAEVQAPLLEAAATAGRVHRSIREERGLHRPTPPEDAAPGAVREALLAVLEEVEERVHGPLQEALDAALPITRTVTVLDEAEAAARTAAGSLPRSVPAAELLPAGDEGEARRPSSALGRVAATLAGPADRRVVRLRWVARRHCALRLARGLDRWTGKVAREWAVWLAELEVAWSRWAGAVLRTLPEPGDGAGAARAWATTSAAGEALEAALARLADHPPLDALAAEMEADLEHWRESLAGDVEVAGTFLLRTDGPVPAAPSPRTDGGAWRAWEAEVRARLGLHAHLLQAVHTTRMLPRLTAARLSADLTAGWRDATEEVAAGLSDQAERLGGAEGPASLREAALTLLTSLEETLPDPERFRSATAKGGDALAARIQALLRHLPETLVVHPPVEADELPRAPAAHGRPLALRDLAAQAFDTPRMERIRVTLTGVAEAAPAVTQRLREVREVVVFGLDAARREAEQGERGAEERARELAREGLVRGSEAIRAADEPLEDRLAEATLVVERELHAGMALLLERALADRLEGSLLAARTRLGQGWAAVSGRAGATTRRAVEWGRVQGGRVRGAAARIARRGRKIVSAPADVATVGTGRLLASPERVLEGLPLVYQRLFSWDPVEDPSLLAGRDALLAEAEGRWRRWTQEDAVPLLVTGRPGVGVSSFLRVLTDRIRGEGRRCVHDVLERRVTDEASLAAHLAELVGLPPAGTLDGLAAALLDAPLGKLPDLVVLEGLELVYLRAPGGTDLLERLLTLMAETEPRIFWVGSLTSSAWQLVEAAEPDAAAQVDRMEVPALDREALQEAVLRRHRRSGVPLRWQEPEEGRAFLRRRLRRARGAEARARVMEADFFDRLHRTTQGNLRLALFLWLRAAHLDGPEGTLTLRPLAPLDVSFLESLTPTLHFTLKAFVEHGTLTLEEHDRIFRLPRRQSYQIFESLQNRHVIRAVDDEEGDGAPSTEGGRVRFRINPLLVAGVTAALTSRNIMH